MRSQCALLLSLYLAACSNVESLPGYCQGDFDYEEQFSAYPAGGTVTNANICVVTESVNDERLFVVGLGRVEDELLIDGSAWSAELSLPQLTTASRVTFLYCALGRASFPELTVSDDFNLLCDFVERVGGPFTVSAPKLVTLSRLTTSDGPLALDMPLLSTILTLEIGSGTIANPLFIPNSVAPLFVSHLRFVGGPRDDDQRARVNRVTRVDRLEIAAAAGDFLPDAFPDLREVRVLDINQVGSIRACSVEDFLANLTIQPELILSDRTTILPCD